MHYSALVLGLLGAARGLAPPRAALLRRRRQGVALRDAARAVDVADLGVTVEDLKRPIHPETASVMTEGYENTCRDGNADEGCRWKETLDACEVTLCIPGLRGQPAGSLAVETTPTTCTLTSFGMVVWSCVLRDRIKPATALASVADGDDAIPVVSLVVDKERSGRWGGFIASIGENSLL